MKSKRVILYVMTFFTEFTGFLLMFAVSRELAEIKMGSLAQGVAGCAYCIGLGVASILGGHWSDRAGRRWLMFAGYLLQLLGTAGCLAAPVGGIGHVSCFLIFGLGIGMVYAPLIAWLTQNGPISSRPGRINPALIRFCLAWNIGLVGGQLTSGWLFKIAPYWPALLAMTLILVNLILLLPAGTSRIPPRAIAPAHSQEHLDHQSLSGAFARLAWLANLGGSFCMSLVIFILPERMVALHVPSDLHGELLALSRVVAIAAYLAMHWFNFWHHRFSVAVWSQVLAMVGMLLLAMADHVGLLLLGLGLGAQLTGYNYFASLYYSTAGSAEERRGVASGLHEATLAAGFALGGLVGGMVGQFANDRAPYLVGAGAIVFFLAVQVSLYCRQCQSRRQNRAAAALPG